MRYRIPLMILILFLIPLIAASAIALAANAARNEELSIESLSPSQPFSYQGELRDDGQPEPGPCDFQFGLWDAPELGSQVGITQTLTGVQLNDGRFTVLLNDTGQIGASPFAGQALWMAISVDCPTGSGNYVSLTPRQQLTAAPYAHYSSAASSAPWEGIASKPIGFADDVDDDTTYDAGTGLELITTTLQVSDGYQLPQGCESDYLVEWQGAGWGCAEPEKPGYANVIVVAKSGGDFDTIQGALDSITDASSYNQYLVWVAPGIYSETVGMKSWVDIEGAGESLSRITSHGYPNTQGTVIAAANSELRDLTVANTGGDVYSIAIRSSVSNFTVKNVAAVVSGGNVSNRGIFVTGESLYNKISDSTVSVDAQFSTSGSIGLYVSALTEDTAIVLDNLYIEANSSVNEYLYGIQMAAQVGRSNLITATNLTLNVHNTGAGDAIGFRNHGQGTRLTISNSHISAEGSPGYGMYILNGPIVEASNVYLSASISGIEILPTGHPSYVSISHSQIKSGNYAARAHNWDSVINFGSSLIDGTLYSASGDAITCANSYDENYTNASGFNSCP